MERKKFILGLLFVFIAFVQPLPLLFGYIALLGLILILWSVNFFRSNWKNILLFLTTLILIFLVGEVLCRIFIPSESYQFGKKEYYLLNSEGFRDINHSIVKNNNTFRILFLGDSLTFGSGVKEIGDVYPSILGRKLNSNQSKINYEVLNFGKCGANTEGELALLRRYGLKYDLDLIVVGYVINDAEYNLSRKYITTGTFLMRLKVFEGLFYSHFYYFLTSRFYVLESRIFAQDIHRYRLYLYSDKNPNLKEHSTHLKKLVRVAKDNNASIMFVIFPLYPVLSEEPYPYMQINDWVKKELSSEDVVVLDLIDYYKPFIYDDYDNKRSFVVSSFDGHPNELAHEIAADAIYETMVIEGLIPDAEERLFNLTQNISNEEDKNDEIR